MVQTTAIAPVTVTTLKTMEHAEPAKQVSLMSHEAFWKEKHTFRCHECGEMATAYPLFYPMRRIAFTHADDKTRTCWKWIGRGLIAHWNCLYRYGEVKSQMFSNMGSGLCTLLAEEVYRVPDILLLKRQPDTTNTYVPVFQDKLHVFEAVPAHVTVQIPWLEPADPGVGERILDTSVTSVTIPSSLAGNGISSGSSYGSTHT